MEKLVLSETNDYGVIYLNRANKRNAISFQMANELLEELKNMQEASYSFSSNLKC